MALFELGLPPSVMSTASLLFLLLFSFQTSGEFSRFQVAESKGSRAGAHFLLRDPSGASIFSDVRSIIDARKTPRVEFRDMLLGSLKLRGGSAQTTGYGLKADAEAPKSFARRDTLLDMQAKAQKRYGWKPFSSQESHNVVDRLTTLCFCT